ncbi:MAG: hypothetical protein P4L51_04880 [Puia sp.]|nr:hypothetical protein [Puia sp.]
MKRTILSLLAAVALVITGIHTASASAGEPVFKGSENFTKTFPEAMIKSYETTKNGHTKVTFTWNGDALEAFYDDNGELEATSHFLNVNTLPISVQMKVRDGYKDYSVIQAVEFYHTQEGLSYFLMLKKENKGLIVRIDAQGEMSLVKKLQN